MGGVLRLRSEAEARSIFARAVATGPIERLDLVKNGEVLFALEGGGRESLELLAEDAEPARSGDYLYARVVQEDGGLAWSSPVWLETSGDR